VLPPFGFAQTKEQPACPRNCASRLIFDDDLA
jgi:hypothetical protein